MIFAGVWWWIDFFDAWRLRLRKQIMRALATESTPLAVIGRVANLAVFPQDLADFNPVWLEKIDLAAKNW